MNLDELQSAQSRERQTDQLQQLRATFYEEAGQFVNQLREERERAADRADDPFDSPEVNRLTDDIKTAEQTIEAIYERRIGKIVKMASLAAADMPTEDDGLTQEEADLFETMVEAIKRNRNHVLDVIAGEAPTGAVGGNQSTTDGASQSEAPQTEPSSQSDESPASNEPSVGAADVMGGDSGDSSDPASPESTPGDRPADEATAAVEPGQSSPGPQGSESAPTAEPRSEESASEESAPEDRIERQTVRITDDVGPIFGVDQREYDLSTDDVVTLPRDNATPLVEKDAAEPLE